MPYVRAIQCCAIGVASAGGRNAITGSKEGESGTIVVSGNHYWKHRMGDSKRRADIDRGRPVDATVTGMGHFCVTISVDVTDIDCTCAIKVRSRFADVVLAGAH